MATMKNIDANTGSDLYSNSSREKGVLDGHVENSANNDAIAQKTVGIAPPADLEFTQEEEDRVHRKLDYRLLPLVWVL